MGKGASIEAHVDISFGLAIGLSVAVFFETAKEKIMENSSSVVTSIMASVWCGAAFLRSLVEKSPTQARDRRVLSAVPSKSERARFDSSPPRQFRKVSSGANDCVKVAPVIRTSSKTERTLLAAHAEV